MKHLIWLRRDCFRSELACIIDSRLSRAKCHYIIRRTLVQTSRAEFIPEARETCQLAALRSNRAINCPFLFLFDRERQDFFFGVPRKGRPNDPLIGPQAARQINNAPPKERTGTISFRTSTIFRESSRQSNHSWLRILRGKGRVGGRRYFELARIPVKLEEKLGPRRFIEIEWA